MKNYPLLPAAAILQKVSTPEVLAVLNACMSADVPVKRCAAESLEQYAVDLRNGALPVGSVEFVREAMHTTGLIEPEWSCYPISLQKYFHRTIQRGKRREIVDICFVKPVTTKLFDGFVLDPDSISAPEDVHTALQWSTLNALDSETELWIAEPVEFISEWRYYVTNGRLVARARYDQHGCEQAPQPNPSIVADAVLEVWGELGHSFALDMGVLSNGETALVEVNDAWAIGRYGGSITPRAYLEFLQSRWADIASQPQVLEKIA